MARKAKERGVKKMLERLLGPPVDIRIEERLKYYRDKPKVFPEKFLETSDFYTPDYSPTKTFKEDADALVINVLLLDVLFCGSPKKVKAYLKGDLKGKDLLKRLDSIHRDMLTRFGAYRYWLKHFEKVKELLCERNIDFEKQRIDFLIENREREDLDTTPEIFKTPKFAALYASQFLEAIEEEAYYKEYNPDDMAEKAKYYIKLGQPQIAEELIDEILDANPEHSKALYLKALIFLSRAQTAQKEFFFRGLRVTWAAGTAITSEERWREENMEDAFQEARSRKESSFKTLLKAYRLWPVTEEYKGEIVFEDPMSRFWVMKHIVGLAFRESHPDLTSDFGHIIKASVRNEIDKKTNSSSEFGNMVQHLTDKDASFFSGETDELIKQIITEVWETHSFENEKERLWLRLQCLQLCLVLDNKSYFALFQKWMAELENSDPEIVKSYFLENNSLRNEIFMSHFMRNMSFESINSFLHKINQKIQRNNQSYFQMVIIEKYQKQIKRLYKKKNYSETLKLIQEVIALIGQYKLEKQDRESNEIKFLYQLLRVAFDLAVLLAEEKKYSEAVIVLYVPFEYKNDILCFLKGRKYLRFEREYDIGWSYYLDDFDNYDSIFEEEEHIYKEEKSEYSSELSQLVCSLMDQKRKLGLKISKKLDYIEHALKI